MVWTGSNGIVAYSSHDIPFLRKMEKLRTEPLTREEIEKEANSRIEILRSEYRATKELQMIEEQAIGWNTRGLS